MYRVLAVALLLSACGEGYDRVTEYTEPLVDHQSGGKAWKVADKYSERRVLVMTDPDRAFALGATFQPEEPEAELRAAAASYVSRHGRSCHVVDGERLMTMTYEFTYRC